MMMSDKEPSKVIAEIAFKMFSRAEVQNMSKNSKAALARRIEWMLRDGHKFDKKTLRETRASLEKTTLHPALAPLPQASED